MESRWLLVANGSRARLFQMVSRHRLNEIKDFAHPAARLANRDLESDRQGRTFDSEGAGRHRMEPDGDAKQKELSVFARELADFIDKAFEKGDFNSLVLICAPALLGLLRSKLEPAVIDSIDLVINKDLTEQTAGEILATYHRENP